jgi:hypothetical protein
MASRDPLVTRLWTSVLDAAKVPIRVWAQAPRFSGSEGSMFLERIIRLHRVIDIR